MSEAYPGTVRDRSTGSSTARQLWMGRIVTGIVVLFLAFDAGIKLFGVRQAVEGTVQLGYSEGSVFVIGVIAAVCLVLYVIPQTAPIGAILLTGYLGGAIATQLRAENPLLTHTLFPLYVAGFVLGGLYLRDARVRALLHP
ncbi:MAG: DoxX family protein [Gemmatimonadaceae bacterium]